MRIKKYTASTMKEALLAIKQELGDDAMILKTQKVPKKIFRRLVTVGLKSRRSQVRILPPLPRKSSKDSNLAVLAFLLRARVSLNCNCFVLASVTRRPPVNARGTASARLCAWQRAPQRKGGCHGLPVQTPHAVLGQLLPERSPGPEILAHRRPADRP